MAITTDSTINISPATAILLRLNAFQVRWDGVNSAKSFQLISWLNIAYLSAKNKVLSHHTTLPHIFSGIAH